MMKSTKFLFLLLSFFLMHGVAFAADGTPEGPFLTIIKKLVDAFMNTRTVIFVVGGFGLVGLAVGAIFGKINWKWFASLAIGLVIVAIAGAIISYSTNADVSTLGTNFSDTLT
jgi:hypothetical protein